jgi:imidazolonepropionase
MKRVYRRIECLVTNRGLIQKRGVQPTDADLGLIHNSALVFDDKQGVVWVGPDKQLPSQFKKWKNIDAKGHVAYPGLVDCHTHLAFAGNRAHEFELRMQGASYLDIAKAGGGILYSMDATRRASTSQLTELISARLDTAYNFGVRLMESKSGYGLNFSAELKSLKALNGARKGSKVALEITCMSAHALPPEFKNNRKSYIDEICQKHLPRFKGLAKFCDVFCDSGFFTAAETRQIFTAAKALGYKLRLHGEEIANTGAAELAAQMGASSVDHLLKVSDRGISALARSQTVAVLLPSTSLYLREAAAPARKLIDAGVAVAIATDFNPGTSPTQNLPLVGTLAALQLGMTTAEIIAALTFIPAVSLDRQNEFGALMPGFVGTPIFCRGDHPSTLFYQMAPAQVLAEPNQI